MSLYILKRKQDNKTRHNVVNSAGGGFNLAVTNTGVNKSKCSTNYAKTPIIQQSYRNLYKTRIRDYVEPNTIYKRMPEFSSGQYLENKVSAGINDNKQGVAATDNKMLTAGQQIARVKARRVCDCAAYDIEVSGNASCSTSCG
jgi:hypothetical protein